MGPAVFTDEIGAGGRELRSWAGLPVEGCVPCMCMAGISERQRLMCWKLCQEDVGLSCMMQLQARQDQASQDSTHLQTAQLVAKKSGNCSARYIHRQACPPASLPRAMPGTALHPCCMPRRHSPRERGASSGLAWDCSRGACTAGCWMSHPACWCAMGAASTSDGSPKAATAAAARSAAGWSPSDRRRPLKMLLRDTVSPRWVLRCLSSDEGARETALAESGEGNCLSRPCCATGG